MRKMHSLYLEQKKRIGLTLYRFTEKVSFENRHLTNAGLISMINGEGWLLFDDGTEVFMGRGDCFIYKRNSNYKFICTTEVEVITVHFNFSDFIDGRYRIFPKRSVSAFLNELSELKEPIKGDQLNAKRIQESLFMLESEFEQAQANGKNKAVTIKAYFLLILSLFFDTFSDDFDCEEGEEEHIYKKEIARSIQYIHEHLTEKIMLDELAKIALMGKTNYSLSFKKIKGMTVWEYILKARIELAASYLTEKDREITITELAFLCGFNNSTHFNKMFKKLKGKTPSEFKREHSNPCF